MKKTIITIACIFALMLTTASASAVSKPAKVSLTSVKAQSSTAIKATWKKASGASGYEVYRDGKKVTSVTGTSYTNSGLKENTSYTYKVRAYKKYKQKKWYNKKTKKWQVKKPAKKNRGKSKKFTAYKYGSFSTPKTATTLKGPEIIEGSLTLKSAPKAICLGTAWNAEFVMPTKGSLEFSTSDKSIVNVYKDSANESSVKLSPGSTAGEAVITATFIPAAGYDCNGDKTVSFTVKNTYFPANADGTYEVYAVWEDAIADENTYIGGYWREFGNILTELPNGATINVSVENMDRMPLVREGMTQNKGWSKGIILSSSNENVATCTKTEGVIFVAPGNTDLTIIGSRVIHVVVRP